jgi:hypothetical protein
MKLSKLKAKPIIAFGDDRFKSYRKILWAGESKKETQQAASLSGELLIF